jgi:NADH-quinone oxidoreductase subunit J
VNQGLFYSFHFYLFGLIAIASAVAFVTRKSPVAAALWLVTTMFSLAVLFVMLDAQFIGAIQVLVYAGAIMVVFLFVIMLLNLGRPEELADIRSRKARLVAGLVGLALLAQLLALQRFRLPRPAEPPPSDEGVVARVAGPLFAADGHLLAFEVTSVLLLAAIVGAVVLAKRRL